MEQEIKEIVVEFLRKLKNRKQWTITENEILIVQLGDTFLLNNLSEEVLNG